MDCPEPEKLESWVAGNLDEETSAALERHVESCASCREHLDDVSENLRIASSVKSALASLHEEEDAPRPTQIGPFRIVSEIGRGGMGIVYLAEQDRPRRQVALKVIRPAASPGAQRRFEHEANLLAQLRHPGIVRVLEAGISEGRPYLAMEHVRGERLDDWTKASSRSLRERLALLAEVCDAVHHAHVHGVVHRDLKPGNVLVVEEGGEPRPRVLDFGVARATDADLQTLTQATEAGQLLGTIPFMSPEQVLGDPTAVDARSDVYSLGVLAHWLLAGELPYPVQDCSIIEAARVIRDEDPRRLSTVDESLKGDVDTIVAKALEKDPGRRYQSASELGADLRRFLADEPIVARPPSTVDQLRKFARRNRTLVGAALAVLVILVAAAGVGSWLAVRATRAERDARAQLERAESEAAKQEAISSFLTRMLSSANPHLEGQTDATVAEALDGAAEELTGGGLAGQPDVEVTVRSALGNAYWALARYDAAEEQLRAAIDVLDRELPERPEERVRALGDLGMLQAETNRWEEAEATFRRQIESARDDLGPDHRLTVRSLSNLAGVLADRGRLADAESVLVEALALSAKLTGEDREVHAANLYTFAGLRLFRGDADAAVTGMREVVALRAELHAPGHPARIASLDGLAAVLHGSGAHDEEARTKREILAQSRTTFGDEHPAVADALNGLGTALSEQGQTAEAESLLREAVAMNRKLRGEEHGGTSRSLNDLAQVLRKEGRYEEAEPLYVEAIAMERRVRGDDHPNVATMLTNLARLHRERGRFAEAEPLLLEALEIRKSRLGEEHPSVAAAQGELAELYKEWGRPR